MGTEQDNRKRKMCNELVQVNWRTAATRDRQKAALRLSDADTEVMLL